MDDRAKQPHWNHRVIEFVEPSGNPWFAIHEVYYDSDGKPEYYTEDAIGVSGDSIDDLSKTLLRMISCLGKPTLKETDFSVGSTAKDGW